MNEVNQIEEIEKLYAKPKSYKIPKVKKEGKEQVKIIMNPLGLDDLALMDMKQDSPMSEISKNVVKLFAISLGTELFAIAICKASLPLIFGESVILKL